MIRSSCLATVQSLTSLSLSWVSSHLSFRAPPNFVDRVLSTHADVFVFYFNLRRTPPSWNTFSSVRRTWYVCPLAAGWRASWREHYGGPEHGGNLCRRVEEWQAVWLRRLRAHGWHQVRGRVVQQQEERLRGYDVSRRFRWRRSVFCYDVPAAAADVTFGVCT